VIFPHGDRFVFPDRFTLVFPDRLGTIFPDREGLVVPYILVLVVLDYDLPVLLAVEVDLLGTLLVLEPDLVGAPSAIDESDLRVLFVFSSGGCTAVCSRRDRRGR